MQRFPWKCCLLRWNRSGKRMNFPWLSRFCCLIFGRRGCHTDCDCQNCHTGNCHTAANHLFRWSFFYRRVCLFIEGFGQFGKHLLSSICIRLPRRFLLYLFSLMRSSNRSMTVFPEAFFTYRSKPLAER